MINKIISIFFKKEHWPYFVFTFLGGTYLIIENGWWYFFNYSSLLVVLLMPAIIFVDLFIYLRKLALGQHVEYKNATLYFIQVILIVTAFLFGLEKDNRLAILLYNGIICFTLLIIMIILSFRKQPR